VEYKGIAIREDNGFIFYLDCLEIVKILKVSDEPKNKKCCLMCKTTEPKGKTFIGFCKDNFCSEECINKWLEQEVVSRGWVKR